MSPSLGKLAKYTLVVCEKPDAAKRVADALDTKASVSSMGKTQVYKVSRNGKTYVICSAVGHLYTTGDPSQRRTIFPVFDVEWYPSYMVSKELRYTEDRIKVIQKLSVKADAFIHACDFDQEGETIGYNILRYACGGKETLALRAKFSTLTRDELIEAFEKAEVGLGGRLAEAGRTRHVIDFLYGVNLSRALSEAFYAANQRYKTVTIGRVQGPTLTYVVEKEIEIQTFVPQPYWVITALIQKSDTRLEAGYEKDKISTYAAASKIKNRCEGQEGIVDRVKKSIFQQSPPTPFNIGDLQREAYRVFGFSPAQTLRIAERLYLDALISYPRTSSQKLPPSINYRKIFAGLKSITSYYGDASELLQGRMKPAEGTKTDPAHPAIYPTGEAPKRQLEFREVRLFDLVVRRFLATFGENALRERVSVIISIGSHHFKLNGRRTVKDGWIKYYRNYTGSEDLLIPDLVQGEVVHVISINSNEKFEQRPSRYNQSSLLEKMEEEGIGTKTTRADVIGTLIDRGYITGESLSATEVGFSIVENMKNFCPQIISKDMTREIESELEKLERGETTEDLVIESAAGRLIGSLRALKGEAEALGMEIRRATVSTAIAQNTLGICPVCKVGKLRVIRSRKTGKRFVGCSNYSEGCRASAPLPQKGSLKITTKTCSVCGWPIVYIKTNRRFPWRLCVNMECPTKEGKKRAVQVVQ